MNESEALKISAAFFKELAEARGVDDPSYAKLQATATSCRSYALTAGAMRAHWRGKLEPPGRSHTVRPPETYEVPTHLECQH